MKQKVLKQKNVIFTISIILMFMQQPIRSMELSLSFDALGMPNSWSAIDISQTLSILDEIDKKLELSSHHTEHHEHILQLIKSRNIIARDDTGKTRLHYAVLLWDFDLITAIMRYPSLESATNIKETKEGETPLHFLLKRSLNFNSEAQQTLDLVSLSMRQSTKLGIVNDQGETYAHYAVRYQASNKECVELRKRLIKTLIMAGVPINASTQDGETALHYAFKHHPGLDDKTSARLEMTPVLLELGASPNAVNSINENSPLHYVVENGARMDCDSLLVLIRLIILKGGNPNAKNNLGHTPLFLLINKEPTTQLMRIAQILLDNGADPNTTSKDGYAPLHVAICKEELKWVKLLLAYPITDPSILHMPHSRTVAPQPIVARTPLAIARAIQEYTLLISDDEEDDDQEEEINDDEEDSEEYQKKDADDDDYDDDDDDNDMDDYDDYDDDNDMDDDMNDVNDEEAFRNREAEAPIIKDSESVCDIEDNQIVDDFSQENPTTVIDQIAQLLIKRIM